MKKVTKIILLTLLFLMMVSYSVFAFQPDSVIGSMVMMRDQNIDKSQGNVTIVNGSADIKTDIKGSVILIFGKATIEGHISEDIVSVFGEVYIKDGSSVDGNLFSIGKLKMEEDVQIKGQKLTIEVDYLSFLKSNTIIISSFIIISLIVLIFGLILISIFSGRYRVMSYSMESGIKRNALLGALVVISCIIILVFLAFLLLLPAVFIVLLMFTDIIASIYFGSFIIKTNYQKSAIYLEFIIGHIIISLVKIVPLIVIPAGEYNALAIYGICFVILELSMASIGIGTIIDTGFGNKKSKYARKESLG